MFFVGCNKEEVIQNDLLPAPNSEISTKNGSATLRGTSTPKEALWSDILFISDLEVMSSERKGLSTFQDNYGVLVRNKVRIVQDENDALLALMMPIQQENGAVNNLFVAQIYQGEPQFYIWHSGSDQSALFVNDDGTNGDPEVWKLEIPNDVEKNLGEDGSSSGSNGEVFVITVTGPNGSGNGWPPSGSTGPDFDDPLGGGGGGGGNSTPVVSIQKRKQLIEAFLEEHELLEFSVWEIMALLDSDCIQTQQQDAIEQGTSSNWDVCIIEAFNESMFEQLLDGTIDLTSSNVLKLKQIFQTLIAKGLLPAGNSGAFIQVLVFITSHGFDEGVLDYIDIVVDWHNDNADIRLDRSIELFEFIENNPDALINGCLVGNPDIDINDYADLFNFDLPQESTDYLTNLGPEFSNQPISNGSSAITNIDYFGIEITLNPDFDNNGFPDTESEVIDAIRANFASLASGSAQNFDPGCPLGPTTNVSWEFNYYASGIDDVLWASNDPVNTMFFIDAWADNAIADLFADPGAVITSQYSSCCWVFSTIQTPLSGSQPLAGNRQFGVRTNDNNNLEFYVRAVDRARLPLIMHIWNSQWNDCGDKDYHDIGVKTWSNLQLNVSNFINNAGGISTINTPAYSRINFYDLREKLKSTTPVSFITCD